MKSIRDARRLVLNGRTTAITLSVVMIMLLIVLSGCSTALVGSGNVVSKTYEAVDFDSLVLTGMGDVTVHFEDNYSVKVTTDDNILPIVTVDVRGGVLTVGQDNSHNRGGFKAVKFDIDITMPSIRSLEVSGLASVNLTDGSNDDINIIMSGVGSVDASNYQVKNANVKISGVGSLKVWATDSISGDLSGVGSLTYKGSPTLDVKKTGVGSINQQ